VALHISPVKSNQSNSREWNFYILGIRQKGKTIPLQAWTGPEGSRRLRLPDFKTIGT